MEEKIMDVLRRMQMILERRTTTGAERSATDDVYRMQSNPGNGSTGCRQELGSGSGRVSDE